MDIDKQWSRVLINDPLVRHMTNREATKIEIIVEMSRRYEARTADCIELLQRCGGCRAAFTQRNS